MKTTTPFKRLDRYAFKKARFQNILEAENYIRKNGADDYIAVDNLLYTMEEYDMDGQSITYYNRRTDNMIAVSTSDRYKNGFSDAKLEIFENYGVYRNDISYAD